MAQLVKLQDYISRYQIDLKRYPTQFVRLKKQQWERVNASYERGALDTSWMEKEQEDDLEVEEKNPLSLNCFHETKKKSLQRYWMKKR